MEKTCYYYIDEAGHINNDSNVFIHGCIITDSPSIINNAISDLHSEIKSDLYFDEFVSRLDEEGFHATENHPDIRAQFYKLLPLLNYRAYFVIIDKESSCFKKLKEEKEDYEIFELFLRKLLLERIIKNKNNKNIFYFEEITIEQKSLINILIDFFESLDKSINCEFHVVGKEVKNLAVVDYLNYVLYSILNSKKTNDRMEKNFNIISPKIGLINILHNNVYLSRKKTDKYKVDLNNLKKEFGG